MNNKEYYKIFINLIPLEIIDKYNLLENKIDGYLYVRVVKVIYCLVQAGIIAHEELKENIRPYGYVSANIKPGLLTHQDKEINFTLVVNDFGINKGILRM